RRTLPARRSVGVLRRAARAEGTRRHRRRGPSVHGTGAGSRRGARRSAGRLRVSHAVIVAAVRTAIGRAPRGALRMVRPDEMAATVMRAAVERAGATAGRGVQEAPPL